MVKMLLPKAFSQPKIRLQGTLPFLTASTRSVSHFSLLRQAAPYYRVGQKNCTRLSLL